MEPEDDIILARCDTENAPKAKRRYGIDGHPVFKWFAQGTTEPDKFYFCLLYTSPSPRDGLLSRMPSSA